MHDDDVWKALADPTRRALLDCLRDGPKTTSALAAQFAQSRFGVMKHLTVLEECGLVSAERRGRERWNHLNAVRLQAASQRWLSPFQSQWAGRLMGLDRYLKESFAMNDHAPALDLDIRQVIDLPASPAQVFDALTRGVDRWWGRPYRQTGDGGVITLVPEIGANMVEAGDDGHAVIWGRVEEVKRPERLYLAGRFGIRGAVAGRVHFDLAPLEGGGCRLTLLHQAVGAIPEETRTGFDAGGAICSMFFSAPTWRKRNMAGLTLDRTLFEVLLAEARLRNPEARAGAMFGSPAVFVGRKLAACVLGGKIGMRVPVSVASRSVEQGRAGVFRPHGKPAMREWIEIDGSSEALIGGGDLLTEAVAFAELNNHVK